MGEIFKAPLFFTKKVGSYSDGWGEVKAEDRSWEDAYRNRWSHDKIVRSTHGVNCTGSCSWNIYVKNGIVVWETQATDYPETPPGVPNHEPRGCPRGASYSWYLYSASRIKHPLIRSDLLEAWRHYRKDTDPIQAWKNIVENPEIRSRYVKARGLGGFVRTTWEEAEEIIASANLYTINQYGPDRIIGFTPIPGYSMVSYGAGTRYLSLIGGTILSFYDWYCDLPPSSPQVWGEQTDVPESASWYYSSYIIVWGTNISLTRTPDAHFLTEARYNGTKVVNVCPDYVETTKNADWWLHPKQGTDAALAMALSHVIFKEFHLKKSNTYFTEYCRELTDLPVLVILDGREENHWIPTRTLRVSDLSNSENESNPEWKILVWDELSDDLVVPNGSIGFRWGTDKRKWNLYPLESRQNKKIRPQLSFIHEKDNVLEVDFPYFGGEIHPQFKNNSEASETVFTRNVPVKKISANGKEVYVATVYDLLGAYLGIDRGLGGQCAIDYSSNIPFTPAWQEQITDVKASDVIALAREFASTALKTHGRACVCMGAGVNQWYQTDNTYRAIINLLLLCGTCGVPGGGWCHYVGQEKVRPQAGWATYSFAQDWVPAVRQMNATSFFYEHTDQWRYERVSLNHLLSPLADKERYQGTFLDFNIQSEMMGWLPSAPQLNVNPIKLKENVCSVSEDLQTYLKQEIEKGRIRFSCTDIDAKENWPRNMFVWRSNILGSSGKGHEYFLKHLLGTQSGILSSELQDTESNLRPLLCQWREAPKGKLDLLINIDFRMSTTSVYSDIVLPTATFYEKNDINTTDMHGFIHPFVQAVGNTFESRSDWEIFKGIASKISEIAKQYEDTFGSVEDVVLNPLMHDSPNELGQALEVKKWYQKECKFVPGKTAPKVILVNRDYRQIFDQYISVGPNLSQNGGGIKGIQWDLEPELLELKGLNGTVSQGIAKGSSRLSTDVEVINFILRISPETNGSLAYRSWNSLEEKTGVCCKEILSKNHIGDRITFEDLKSQPRKTFTAPDWSGTENEEFPYVAYIQNTRYRIPWRTLTGRQQFYLDHSWMRAFGQSFPQYRPPLHADNCMSCKNIAPNGHKAILLNFITSHQKWGIHSTYFDNERMLALSRGGPVLWINSVDADRINIKDNDWIELWNANGAVSARSIVSSRIPEGLCIMQHATEKTVYTPVSEITHIRGGDHNSPTRVVINPTHMIGGYAHLSYSFNYYGTISPNRDDFVWVRKMEKTEWLDN